MMQGLYFDPKSEQTYYLGDYICSECKEDMIGSGIYVSMTCLKTEKLDKHKYRNWFELKNKLYCHKCLSIKRKVYDVVYWCEIRNVVLCSFIPKNAIPILLKPNYEVKDSRMLQSVFTSWINDNSGKNQEECVTIDNTRLAGRESFEGCQVGKSEEQVNFESGDKDKLLSIEEADQFLLDIKNSKPVLSYDKEEIKQLEDHNGKD